MRIIFWGTGNTAKNYIYYIRKISAKYQIIAFTDSRYINIENDTYWEGFKVVTPQMISSLDIDYLCVLSIWEWQIRRKIYKENLFELSKIISYNELYMMYSFEMNLNDCYKKISLSLPLNLRYIVDEWEIYGYFKKNYAYVLCDKKYLSLNTNKKIELKNQDRVVWILWLQGFEQAPELVKVCVHSIKKNLKEKVHICLLDKYNLFDYIDLPAHILQKWKTGIISDTHFSDMVRLRLLNVYGGVWIDATVYFTGDKLPDYLENSDLFMFSRWIDWKSAIEVKIIANWLISARPRNVILMNLEALLNEYWKKENRAINYFIFHIFWRITVENFMDEWNHVEKILRDPAQLLYEELTCKFDRVRFEHLKKMTDFHKLSYKDFPRIKKAGKDSFWGKICEMTEIEKE